MVIYKAGISPRRSQQLLKIGLDTQTTGRIQKSRSPNLGPYTAKGYFTEAPLQDLLFRSFRWSGYGVAGEFLAKLYHAIHGSATYPHLSMIGESSLSTPLPKNNPVNEACWAKIWAAVQCSGCHPLVISQKVEQKGDSSHACFRR